MRPAFAATSTVPLTCTMGNSASPVTLALSESSGSSLSPTTVTCDGAVHNITVDPSITLTATEPGDGSNTRDRFSGGSTTATTLTCSSGTCNSWSLTNYQQLLNTYQWLLGTGTTTSGLAWMFTGTVAGTASSTVCTSSPTSGATSGNCAGWSDYGVGVTAPAEPTGEATNERFRNFADSASTAATPTTGGNTETAVVYYRQESGTAKISASSQTNFDSGLAVAITTKYLGGSVVNQCSPAITVASSDQINCWVDYNSQPSFPATMTGAATNSRWCLISGGACGVVLGTAVITAGWSQSMSYDKEWNLLNTNCNGITYSPASPTGDSYFKNGASETVTCAGVWGRTGGSGMRATSWQIDGSTATNVVTGGTFSTSPIVMTASHTVTVNTATQYMLTLDGGATSALATITSPTIQGDNYWYDSGTQVTFSGNGVYGRASGTGSRVTAWWWDSTTPTSVLTSGTFPASITMGAPHTLHTTTVAQLQLVLKGGYGVSSATQPTIPGDNYWYDKGTTVSLSLDGVFGRASGNGERMISYVLNGGPAISTDTAGSVVVLSSLTLTSPEAITVSSVSQFQLTLDSVSTQALSSVTPPTLSGDNYWYDNGSKVVVVANGVWGRNSTTGYRLSSYSVNGGKGQSVASGSVTLLNLASISSPQSIASTKTAQYLLAVSGGGGYTYSVNPPISGDTEWYDSGTTLTVTTNGTYNSQGGMRLRVASWAIDGGPAKAAGGTAMVTTSAIVMDAHHTVTFNSVTQFLVTIVVRDNSGADVLESAGMQLNVNGGTLSLTGNQIWLDSGSDLSVVGITWHGADIAPSQPAASVAVQPLTVTVNARVFDATIVVKDPFGLPVGHADVTVTLANGTVIHTTTSNDGSLNLRMIPLGTYQATATNLGSSSSVSEDASVRTSAVVGVFLSYPVIGAIILAALLVAVAIIFIIRRRRRS